MEEGSIILIFDQFQGAHGLTPFLSLSHSKTILINVSICLNVKLGADPIEVTLLINKI